MVDGVSPRYTRSSGELNPLQWTSLTSRYTPSSQGQGPGKEIHRLWPNFSLERTLHRDPGHPHGHQGGRTDCLDSPLTCQDCPRRRTMESDLSFSRPPKAKTFVLLAVTFLVPVPLIPGVAPWRGPPLTPTYYRWVLTQGSTGEYVSSVTGKESTLVNLTLEYIPRDPITFSLDLCTLSSESLNINTIEQTKTRRWWRGNAVKAKEMGCGNYRPKNSFRL